MSWQAAAVSGPVTGTAEGPLMAARMAVVLSWASAVRAVCPAERVPGPGLALIPAEGVLPRFERYFNQPLLMPVKQKSSLAWCPDPGR